MFILTLVDLEYETSVFIWEFEMMMVLILSFCLLFKWLPIEIHITQMKLILLMNTDTLICIWILVFPIRIIDFSTRRKWLFLLYFVSLHDCRPPSTWNPLIQTSWAKWNDVKNVIFNSSKSGKKQLKYKIQVRNRHFIDS